MHSSCKLDMIVLHVNYHVLWNAARCINIASSVVNLSKSELACTPIVSTETSLFTADVINAYHVLVKNEEKVLCKRFYKISESFY